MKYFIIIWLLSLLLIKVNAQETTVGQGVYLSGNEKLQMTEYLNFDTQNKEVWYWNDANLDKIKLEMVSGSLNSKKIIVKFPESTQQYYLNFSDENRWKCKTLNGNIQEFHPAMKCIPYRQKFTSTSANSVKEYIYMDGFIAPFGTIYYESSINPQRITLESTEFVIDSKTNSQAVNVKFPGDYKLYYLVFDLNNEKIICTNPDGSKQTFEQEW